MGVMEVSALPERERRGDRAYNAQWSQYLPCTTRLGE